MDQLMRVCASCRDLCDQMIEETDSSFFRDELDKIEERANKTKLAGASLEIK